MLHSLVYIAYLQFIYWWIFAMDFYNCREEATGWTHFTRTTSWSMRSVFQMQNNEYLVSDRVGSLTLPRHFRFPNKIFFCSVIWNYTSKVPYSFLCARVEHNHQSTPGESYIQAGFAPWSSSTIIIYSSKVRFPKSQTSFFDSVILDSRRAPLCLSWAPNTIKKMWITDIHRSTEENPSI